MIGKVLSGLGCLGLLLSVVMLGAGGFMLAMMNDSHLSELGPFGLILTPIGVLVAVVSGLLFVVGLVLALRKPPEEA